jgi:hypothetical protein
MVGEKTPAPAWAGWVWVEDGWRKVASGPTIAETARLLEAEGVRRGVLGKHQVLTGGSMPAFTPTGSIKQ